MTLPNLVVPLGTDRFKNLEAVRDALLTHELSMLLHSHEQYHTSKTNKEIALSLTSHYFNISTQCHHLDSITLTVTIQEKNSKKIIAGIKQQLSSVLDIPEEKILVDENALSTTKNIKIDMSVYHVLHRIREAKKNYHSLKQQGELTIEKFNNQLAQLANTFFSPSEINHAIKWMSANQKNAVIQFLNKNKEQVKSTIDVVRNALSPIKNFSNVGLQALLRQHTIENKEFRALLSDRASCKVLIYLSALGNNTTSLTELGLDREICKQLETPLFSGSNIYTNTKVNSFFSGVIYSNDYSQTMVTTNQSILSDLLCNVTPMALFLPSRKNVDKKNPYQNLNQTPEYVQCYIEFFKNLNELLPSGKKSTGEAFLLEPYDPKKWRKEYIERFNFLASIYEGYDIADNYGKRIQEILSHTDGRIQSIIEQGILFTPTIAHYVLDPKHLQSVLGSNYGEFKKTLFAIMDILKDRYSITPEHALTGIQIFARLKQLEFECYKECTIIKTAPETRQTQYENYVQTFHVGSANIYQETCQLK